MRSGNDARLRTAMDGLAVIVAGLDDDEDGRAMAATVVGMVEQAGRCELPAAGPDEPLVVLQRRFARAAGRLRTRGARLEDVLGGGRSTASSPARGRVASEIRRSDGAGVPAGT
jgi:hypothetical protein